MKTIKKSNVLNDELKKKSVQIEREILEKVNHPLIVKMHHYFETSKNYHFVLDFCPGGELY